MRDFGEIIKDMLLLDYKVEGLYFLAWKSIEDMLEQHLGPFKWTRPASRLDYLEKNGRQGWLVACRRTSTGFVDGP